MKCPRCQSENWDTDTVCSECGASLTIAPPNPQANAPQYQQRPSAPPPPGSRPSGAPRQSAHYRPPASPDKLNPLVGIASFFVPLVGLVLYFIWKDEKPQSAKMAGMIALISFGMTMFFYACLGCVAVSDY